MRATKVAVSVIFALALVAGDAGGQPPAGHHAGVVSDRPPPCGAGSVDAKGSCATGRLPALLPCDLIEGEDAPCPQVTRCWADPRLCQNGDVRKPGQGGNSRAK